MLSAADKEQKDVTISQIEDRQRIKDVDGDWYIDEFGKYVYITNRLGYLHDIDLRYDEHPEPELFTLQHVEYDLRNR